MISTKDLASRPSEGSSIESKRYRARFDQDRKSKLFSKENQQTLADFLKATQNFHTLDEFRSELASICVKDMGAIDHSKPSVDWFIQQDLSKIVRKILKPWKISISKKNVHVFRVVRTWLTPPQQIVDEHTEQHISLSPHDARQSSSSFDNMVAVDVAQWTFTCPHTQESEQESSSSWQPDNKSKEGKLKKNNNNKWKLPEKWEDWPLESSTMHLRQSLHDLLTLSMSWADGRATGTLPPQHFAFEDKMDEGGAYQCPNSAVSMTLHETLGHNKIYTFVGPSGSILTGNQGCETPNYEDSAQTRNLKAVLGLNLHASKAHRIEKRCCHPSRRMRSTSTIVLKMTKYKKSDKTGGGKHKFNLGGQQIMVHMQFLSVWLQPTIVYMALGVSLEEAEQMLRFVAQDNWYEDAFQPFLRKMKLRHPEHIKTEEDALVYIAEKADKADCTREKKINYARNVFIQTEFLPEVGLSLAFNREKALEFSRMILTLFLKAVGFSFYESKEEFAKQRYDTNGIMYASLERKLLGKIHTHTDKMLRMFLQSPNSQLNFRHIFGEAKNSELMLGCFSTGKWSINRFHSNSSRTTATLAHKTTNYWTYYSSVRRSDTATKAHRRSKNAKQVSEAHCGRLCIVETPEGEMCGIARFQAVGSTMSGHCSQRVFLKILRTFLKSYPDYWIPIEKVLSHNSKMSDIQTRFPYYVEVEGHIVMVLREPLLLLRLVREMRRRSLIHPHVGINLDHKIIYIRLSPGRSMRLLINLEHWVLPNFHGVRSLRTLQEGLSTGALEYVDALEEPSLSIAYSLDDLVRRTALGEQFSHMEVDPSWYFGVTAGSLPFSNHDPTPRGLLGSAMAKQTFTAAINPNRLQHMQQLNLEYPMKPLCDTRMLQDLGVWWHGSGHMVKFVVVATDFDIEDSTDKNKGATERGLHRTTITRRYSAAIKPQLSNSGDRTNDVKKVEVFENPNKQETIGIQYANYNKIQKNGLPLTGTSLQKNDIVIGKTIREWKPHQSEEPKKRDDSICIKEDSGVVQSVKSVQVGDGSRYQFKEVTLRTECLNETGDKFYTRYGQKGTIGIDRVESDCYFSVVSGVPATIHFSPIGLLARMTDGLVQEIERSNAAAIVGKYVNATAFLSSAQKQKQIDVVSVLLAHGAQQMSYEVFVDGKTGELTQPLLTGLCYMCPLAHLVANKIHARDGGPVQFITRQPEEGRSRDGGLRFGQMEMDAMNALGAANTVAEKLTKGDSLKIGNCQKCGTSVRYNKQKSLKMCKVCGTGKHIVETTISFALKTCIQEIQSMGIRAQLIVSPDEFDSSRTKSSTSNAANSDESEYYNQSLEPEPEAWEFEKYGIPKPKNLKDLLNLS